MSVAATRFRSLEARGDTGANSARRAHIAAAVVQRLLAADVRAVVLSGAGNYPVSVGRDIDLLVHDSDRRRAAAIVADELTSAGMQAAYFRRDAALTTVVGRGDDGGGAFFLGFDLARELGHSIASLARYEAVEFTAGPFPHDSWPTFVKQFLLPLLGGDVGRMRAPCRATPQHRVRKKLNEWLGATYAQSVLLLASGVHMSDVELCELRRGVHWRIVRRALLAQDLMTTTSRVALGLTRRVRRPRSGALVALLGPDGVGKSTVAETMCARRPAPFAGVVVRHWAPRILPQPGHVLGRVGVAAGSRTSARAGGRKRPSRAWEIFDLLRCAYIAADYALGLLGRDRRLTHRGRCVVYDRWAYDCVVDPSRFGFRHARRYLGALLRIRPDAALLLTDDASAIVGRKAELSVAGTNDLLARWRRLAAKVPIDAIPVAGLAPEVIADWAWTLAWDVASRGSTASAMSVPSSPAGADAQPDRGEAPSQLGTHALIAIDGDRKYVVALRDERTVARAADLYQPAARAGRTLKRVVQTRAGGALAATLLARKRTDGSSAKELIALGERIRAEFAERIPRLRGAAFSISLGNEGPNRKPTFQYVDADGAVAAYVKAAATPAARALLANEHHALGALEQVMTRSFEVPATLAFTENWCDLTLLFLEPMGEPEPRQVRGREQRVAAVLANLVTLGLSAKPLESWDDWSDLTTASSDTRLTPVVRAALMRGTEVLARQWDDRAVHVGCAHGDLAPWHVIVRPLSTYLYDWEHSSDSALVGSDAIHYAVQRGRLRGIPAQTSLFALAFQGDTAERRLVASVLRAASVPEADLPFLALAYALVQLLRAARRDAASARTRELVSSATLLADELRAAHRW